MSQTSSSDEKPVVYSKPQPNVYTVLLVLALLALIVGIVFLYRFMEEYQFKIKGGPSVSMASQVEQSSGRVCNEGSGFRVQDL